MIILLVILHDFKVAGIWLHNGCFNTFHLSLLCGRETEIKPNLRLLLQWVYGINKPSSAIQSSSVNTDTEGAVGSVRIKLVEFRENLRASLPGDKANCP